jgi:hypothetical protein
LSIALVSIATICWLRYNKPSADAAAPGIHAPYSTSFPMPENPVSEGGRWINGGKLGLNWANVIARPGLAFGSQSGNGGYDDSTAVLSGDWGPNQTATATIYTINQPDSRSVFEEVELRLRTTISAHRITGYEINFSCSANPANFYSEIVRWNGPLGSFTYLKRSQYHCVNGDVVKAAISGDTITVSVNKIQTMQVTDRTYASGSPGMGFFLQGSGPEANADFGFLNFTASDGREMRRDK